MYDHDYCNKLPAKPCIIVPYNMPLRPELKKSSQSQRQKSNKLILPQTNKQKNLNHFCGELNKISLTTSNH